MNNELKRYVLIDCNKIIDIQSDEWLLHCKEQAKIDEDYNVPFRELIEAHLGKIKKQSDNVYDLIERETDLVKIELLGNYFNIVEAKTLNGNWKENDRISTIYKPNANGDYIKVWEKEK